MPTIVLTVFAAACLFTSLLFLGYKKSSYSHVRHTISELGEVGTPHQQLVAFGIFAPVGAILLLVAYLARSASPETAALALCISIGYLVAAVFPCDRGSPFSGTNRQAIHNLGGAVEYLGGAFALFRVAGHFGQLFQDLGFIVLCVAIAISVPQLFPARGLIQRVGELCLFGGLALALWHSGARAV